MASSAMVLPTMKEDMDIISFSDFIVEHNGYRVTWEWIGEGNDGDYNPDDPEDQPLLRFSCDKYTDRDEDGNLIDSWEGMENASYCTQLPITTPKQYLARGAAIILEAIDTDKSYKRELERLSWFCLDDFSKEKQ